MNMPKTSYGQHLIEQSVDQAKGGQSKTDAEAKERNKMVENSRKSNFAIGELNKVNDKNYARDTSSNAAYKYDGQKISSMKNQNQKLMDFKVANFKLGSTSPSYVTTNTDEYNNERI